MISYVITVKGRKSHIVQTIPRLIATNPSEVILVDYCCPERSGEWVLESFPTVRVIFVENVDTFHLARARNIGAKEVNNEWICFLDADIILSEDFNLRVASILRCGFYYRPSQENSPSHNYSLYGTVICEKSTYESIYGYDEIIKNWGEEDTDFYQRLELAGTGKGTFSNSLVSSITHDDIIRTEYYDIKSRSLSQAINRTYIYAKKILLIHFNLPELPLHTRQSLMSTINKAYQNFSRGSKCELIEFHSSNINQWLPVPYRLSQELVLRFQVTV